VATTSPSRSSGTDLRLLAESRRIQAFQRLREAQHAERDGRFGEARILYVQALELDANNVAAKDGRDRVVAQLSEAPPPRRPRSDARIMGNSGPIRYDFQTAVEEADKAVAAKQFGQARSAWRRAREAAGRHPEIFPPSDIQAFQSALLDLDRRIFNAEAAEIQSLRRAGRHEAAARIEAQRVADQAATAPATRPASHSR
jgi:hypothetical protein